MTNKKEVKNAAQVAKGHVEETAGRVSGNDRLEEDGEVDQMTGNIRQAGEKVKDAVKK
jgi:uncharacterized protein YjbJ (UPF0337 family)